MANRTTVKSNIITKNVPSVSNVILTDMLNAELADNLKFKEDVAVIQASAVSNIVCDFAGKDRIDLTRTGGSLNISVANIGDGDTVFIVVNKTAGQAVTFTGVTDITNVKTYADALTTVLYEIVRKGNNYFAWAWVETVKQATESIAGVLRIASTAEANALTAADRIITPANLPRGATSQKGIAQLATQAEANALTEANKYLSPAILPRSTTSQVGMVKIADANAIDAGMDNPYTGVYLVVPPSQLKRKLDELATVLPTWTTVNLAPTGWNGTLQYYVDAVGMLHIRAVSLYKNLHIGVAEENLIWNMSGFLPDAAETDFVVAAVDASNRNALLSTLRINAVSGLLLTGGPDEYYSNKFFNFYVMVRLNG